MMTHGLYITHSNFSWKGRRRRSP